MSSNYQRKATLRFRKAFSVIFLIASSASLNAASGKSAVVFECQTGTKRIMITEVRSNLRYEFGPPDRPEIVIVATPTDGTVHQIHDQGAHSEFKQIRFTNNGFSYAVFSDWASPDYNQKGARDVSGLKVFKGSKKIAMIACKNGGEFVDDFPFETYTDEIPEFR